MSKEKIEMWRYAKEQLDYFKAKEVALRREICEDYFPNSVEGSVNAMEEDFLVKATFSLNYSLDKETLACVELSEDEAACISWTPRIRLKVYKDLTGDETVNLDQALSIKPGLPTLKIEEIDGED